MLSLFLRDPPVRSNMISLADGSIDRVLFMDFMKCLYCPKSLDSHALSFDEVRQITIKPTKARKKKKKMFLKKQKFVTVTCSEWQADVKHHRLWLPPSFCRQRLC